MNGIEKAQIAVKAIAEKKGFDIQLLDVKEITQIAECFVICQAKNRSQTQAIADEVMDKIEELGEHPLRVEGYQAGAWILLDFNDLIVHIFLPEEQEYYKLPRLWKDARFTHFDMDGNPVEVKEEEEKTIE